MRSLYPAKALALVLALVLGVAAPASAESIRILTGDYSGTLEVPMNRAVVIEAAEPFAEVSIANPNIADISTLSDRTIYVLGKTPGRTTLTLLAADGRLLTNAEVQVIPDVGEFKERLRQILPGEPIEVRTANDGIVLSGTVSSIVSLDRALELAERYAPGRVSNLLGVGGVQQVMLKVRFAEMSRNVSKQISTGLSLSATNDGDSFSFGAPNLGAPSAGGQITAALTIGSTSLNALLDTLESRGLVRFLAEPNLVARTGQEAEFLAGGEFAIPTVTLDGATQVEFKPFGIQMIFTPHVLGDGLINLELGASVSSLDFSIAVGGVPGLSTRATTTTVELRDGQSFAIAGLLLDDFTDSSDGVPMLRDVPLLGPLFRSSAYNRNQTELVIIVTAHLVEPTRGDNYALPTDRVRIPTEAELFRLGRTEGQLPQGPVGEVARQDFGGPYGYVLD